MEIAHARAAEAKSVDNSMTKRRKVLDSGELVNLNSEKLNQCSCLIGSPENSNSPARTTVSSDQSPACSNEFYDKTSRSANLKVENPKTNNSTFMNSRELTSSSLSDVMETTTKKTKNKASSARKKPSMEEIEEFFSVAEKYEAKRFAEKYNYDIVKDVPLEGKYQWVRIKQ